MRVFYGNYRVSNQTYLTLGCLIAVVSVVLLSTAGLLAQEADSVKTTSSAGECQQAGIASPSQEKTEKGTKSNARSENPCTSKSKDESEGQQTNRILGIVPNFGAVSANTQLPPLTTKGKFWLATQDSFDYSSFIWTGVLAGQQFGSNSYPEFGQGAAGYGRYYWHSFVDGVSGTFFTEAIVPWATRQDPRYYTMGHGGFFRRTGYALSRVVLTKTDAGGTSFNWSEVVGNAFEAGLSNAYYPREERGLHQTAINWGTQLESAALNNIAKEFWPDFRRVVLRRK